MEGLICHKCKQEFTWDAGNDNRGNIYRCENEMNNCENYICFSCLLEAGYKLQELDTIKCLYCKDKGGK